MNAIEERLRALGLVLPAPPEAPPGVAFPFDPARVEGNLAYVSGHGPTDGEAVLWHGKVGTDVSPDEARAAARATALAMCASLRRALGSLERVRSWVQVTGFVNAAPGFTALPSVVNGFSEVVLELWEERGRHARTAVGVAELPFGIPVEVQALVALEAQPPCGS